MGTEADRKLPKYDSEVNAVSEKCYGSGLNNIEQSFKDDGGVSVD